MDSRVIVISVIAVVVAVVIIIDCFECIDPITVFVDTIIEDIFCVRIDIRVSIIAIIDY